MVQSVQTLANNCILERERERNMREKTGKKKSSNTGGGGMKDEDDGNENENDGETTTAAAAPVTDFHSLLIDFEEGRCLLAQAGGNIWQAAERGIRQSQERARGNSSSSRKRKERMLTSTAKAGGKMKHQASEGKRDEEEGRKDAGNHSKGSISGSLKSKVDPLLLQLTTPADADADAPVLLAVDPTAKSFSLEISEPGMCHIHTHTFTDWLCGCAIVPLTSASFLFPLPLSVCISVYVCMEGKKIDEEDRRFVVVGGEKGRMKEKRSTVKERRDFVLQCESHLFSGGKRATE